MAPVLRRNLNMSSKFERPEDSRYPVVHYKFMAKNLQGDELVEYRVQDLTQEITDKAVEFWMKHFLTEETMCHAAGQEFRDKVTGDFLKDIIKGKTCLVCFAEGSDDIVGLNILVVESKADKVSVNQNSLLNF